MASGYLAVARFRRPHGLRGEAHVWVLTDDPDDVFVVGRSLTPIDETGQQIGEPLVIERERTFHRDWLLKFSGIGDRTTLDEWEQILLGVPQDDLAPPGEGEMYVHEIPGAKVAVAGEVIGHAEGLIDVPGGALLSIDVNGKEVLVPFCKPFVVAMRRAERCIDLDPPPGLLDL